MASDDRFAVLSRDPKFRKIKRKETKVKIDDRFKSMFTKDKFKVKYTVDKRGRPIHGSNTEDFKKFYHLSSGEDDDDKDEDDENEGEGKEIPEVEVDSATREKLKDMKVDYARGESILFPYSSSDESLSSSEDISCEGGVIFHEWNELDRQVEKTSLSYRRIAICNMDWDRIRAVDLFLLLKSFLPANGVIHSVKIYPSEFGKERMKEEDIKGPKELIELKNDDEFDSDEELDEESSEFVEQTRQYQINRLKYYYAIATFDSATTADFVYEKCNGVEYESSANRLDLRFVDDEESFNDDEAKDSCEGTDDMKKYEPRFYTTTALQQAKVRLTWDETDPKRAEFQEKIALAAKRGDVDDSDVEKFVALTSSESENEEGNNRDHDDDENESSEEEGEKDSVSKYRDLLRELEKGREEKEEEDVEMQITWGDDPGCVESAREKETAATSTTDYLTPFQRIVEKKKERAKARRDQRMGKNRERNSDDDELIEKKGGKKRKIRAEPPSREDTKEAAELELLVADDEEDDKKHFSLKKIKEAETANKKKRRRRKLSKKYGENESPPDDFQVDVKDERFEALYSSHLFNIDPADSKFHKTKGMRAFVDEKQKRISRDGPYTSRSGGDGNSPGNSAELRALVKSVKSKINKGNE